MKKEKTLETFLRDKLESEIGAFGDGTTEFHTRDLEELVNLLDKKDDQIRELKERLLVVQPADDGFIKWFDREEKDIYASIAICKYNEWLKKQK